MDWCTTSAEGQAVLHVRVTPRAKRDEIQGLHAGRLKIRLAAPPVEGKANTALIRFLAAQLGIQASRLSLASGEKSREKTVAIRGVSADAVQERLARVFRGGGCANTRTDAG